MKLIKYFVCFLLYFIVIIFIGEMYVWHLGNFETAYTNMTFYMQRNTIEIEMLQDISEVAKQEKVDVFVVERNTMSQFSSIINLYITEPEVATHLASGSHIKNGSFDSVFLGNVTLTFKEWEEIPDLNKVEQYYVIGEDENILNFKKALVDQYAGCFPKEGYQEMESSIMITAVWTCIILFLLILTFYEVALLKKAFMIRIIIGENILFFILRLVIFDVMVYFSMFIGLMYILKEYTNTFFLHNISFLFIGALLFFNSLTYLWLLFPNYKQDMHTKTSALKILKISYFYKLLTSALLILLMSNSFELIFDGINSYRQKTFFEDRKESYYFSVGGELLLENSMDLSAKTYQYAAKNHKEIGLVDLGAYEMGIEYVFADKGAIDYLKTEIREFSDIVLLDKIYFIVPEEYVTQIDIINEMKKISKYYVYGDKEYEYELVGYDKTAWIMAMTKINKVNSDLKKNPFIILDNTQAKNVDDLYLTGATMFTLSDYEIDTIFLENGYEEAHYYKTNAYDLYQYYWIITKRYMIMGIVFLLLLLLIEGMILRGILKYEYQLNAKKLLLGEIHGNGFFYRHKPIIYNLFVSWLLLLITSFLCWLFNYSTTLYILIGGIIIMTLELVLVILFTRKLEQTHISKIFKGGAL